jgi:tetratricopeptide (TPR) repeat protein
LALAYNEEALALSQARRDPRNIARQLMHLGLAVGDLGEPALARQHFEASVTIARELEDWVLISLCLLNLGNLLLAQGDAAGARASLDEALTIYRAYHYWTGADATLATLGRALEQLGDLEGARARQVAALRLRVDGERRAVPISLTNLARLDYRENRPARAARLMGAAEAIREATGASISPSRRAEYERWVADVRAALGETALAEAWTAGRALSLEEAVALALASP